MEPYPNLLLPPKDEVLGLVRNKDARLRKQAIDVCTIQGYHDEDSIAAIVDFVANDLNLDVRLAATCAIERLMLKEAIPSVIANLRSNNYLLRAESCWCLKTLLKGEPTQLRDHLQSLCGDLYPTVAYVACRCLREVGQLTPDLERTCLSSASDEADAS